ncbi:hypothetical protein [Lysobacter sp. CA199]|uniref:hypothetical protein n=1 Tax=Lysobacter sp. CA199 TaxID=3455608 RepID=UPI003F8D7A31
MTRAKTELLAIVCAALVPAVGLSVLQVFGDRTVEPSLGAILSWAALVFFRVFAGCGNGVVFGRVVVGSLGLGQCGHRVAGRRIGGCALVAGVHLSERPVVVGIFALERYRNAVGAGVLAGKDAAGKVKYSYDMKVAPTLDEDLRCIAG